MDFFFVLLALLAMAILCAGVVAFFMALGARARLSLLETKFAEMEAWVLRGQSVPAPQPPRPSAQPEAAVETPAAAAAPEPEPEPDASAVEPEPPAAEVPPASALPPMLAPAPTTPGFEERFGTRWVVWVGGVALALGAMFLVRFSIEQGLLGPGVRVALGALLAAALVAGGEWLRRRESALQLRGLPQASIPAILTAAGTAAAYATTYAAYALYGFLGPGAAFVMLGMVALLTLAAALLHGPALAGLGLVGAYVTPLLVESDDPNFWALYLFLAVVTGAAFALARARLWRWLAITAVAVSACWLLPSLLVVTPNSALVHAVYLAVVFALAAALIVSGLAFGPEAEPDRIDGVSAGALAAYVAAAALLVVASGHATAALAVFVLLAAATVAAAWRAPSATPAVPIAAALAALVMADWVTDFDVGTLVAPGGPVSSDLPSTSGARTGAPLAFGAGLAALFGLSGYAAQGRSGRATIALLWSASAVVAPIAILIALYYQVAGFDRSIPFAGVALVLAALYAVATEALGRRAPQPSVASGQALFAVGAIASLALALTMALEKGWLTVALALMAPGIAMVFEKRPLPLLRWLAAGCAVVVAARLALEPRVVSDVGATPIFNWLLWGYGVPALCFWAAAAILRRRADDVPARMLDSAAIVFTVLTLMLQIRHYAGSGDIYGFAGNGLMEAGMQVAALLAVAIGLERVRGRSGSPVHDVAALAVAGLAAIAIVGRLIVIDNPLSGPIPVGAPVFNLLLLSYGLPALLAGALALVARDSRPMEYRIAAAAAAVVLMLAYLTLQVRRFYQGPLLDGSAGPTTDAELWTYSAVWLGFGVALLLLGILVRSQPARLASAAVILVAVAKVFVYDLAGIGGVWRALSFIGLGLVLVGIGLLYQRLLFPPRPAATPPAQS